MTPAEQILLDDAEMTIKSCRAIIKEQIYGPAVDILVMRLLNCEESIRLARQVIGIGELKADLDQVKER